MGGMSTMAQLLVAQVQQNRNSENTNEDIEGS